MEMLKREKNRAAAAEASLHGTSVSSSTHQPTGQKTIINSDTLREQRAADASHQDGHSQHESSSSNSQLSEHQRSHKASHKGIEYKCYIRELELHNGIVEICCDCIKCKWGLFRNRIVSCKTRSI